MRRLRRNKAMRRLFEETAIDTKHLVYPVFVREGISKPEAIEAMPGQYHHTIDTAIKEARQAVELGLGGILLFGLPLKKDEYGSSAYDSEGIVQRTLEALSAETNERLVLITDVCLCQYTSHGHCGIVKNGEVLNDETLELLAKIAISHAAAGADIVAPSGMIDGQVKAIRKGLDEAGQKNVSVLAYSAKHASCFYGPFREAASSAPSWGDRRSYQMNYLNPREALREVELDIKEGADMVMVKPALAYLDLIHQVRQAFRMPVAAYNVSGEYAMVKAAAEHGWLNEKQAIMEIIGSIKRAGADVIITYYAKDIAQILQARE